MRNNSKLWIALTLCAIGLAGCTPTTPIAEPEVSLAEVAEETTDELLPEEELSFEEVDEKPQQQEPNTPNIPASPIKLQPIAAITDNDLKQALATPLEQLEQLDNTPIPWGPGTTQGEIVPPAPKDLQNKYGNYGVFFYVPNQKQMYLSFDEGYELGYTPAILDVLKETNTKAVFFVTLGYVQSEPDLVRRMIDEGHIVGNHSSAHPVGGMPVLSTTDMAKDILYLHRYVEKNFGYQMSLFRPPEGTFSLQSLAVTQALGYHSIFWSFAYNDWNPENQMPPTEALAHMTAQTHPGAIYLLHAVSQTNTEILPEIIAQFIQKGYTISDWSDMIKEQ